MIFYKLNFKSELVFDYNLFYNFDFQFASIASRSEHYVNDHRGPHITNVEVRLARMEARLSLLESLVIRPSTSMPSSSESAPLANAQPANDSLKHASVGVSLSKLEASIAPPFTCNIDSIRTTPQNEVHVVWSPLLSVKISFIFSKWSYSWREWSYSWREWSFTFRRLWYIFSQYRILSTGIVYF